MTVESGALRGEVIDGVRRWAPPQRPLSWAGQRGATANAPGCLQLVTPDGFGPWTKEYVTPAPVSEDCLYANVWVPAEFNGQPRPILVWIHGGAFMSGSNSVPIYDGSELAKKGVIVISINYRLGVFGFAAFRELADEVGGGANFGLQDIVASLDWVQRNAAAFGGDPAQVTIAGQSAGAMAVHTLLVSPASSGLFSRAIAQSGVIETPLPVREEGYRRGDDLRLRAATGSLADLRRMPADRIMALLSQGPLAGTAQIGETSLLGPIIDGSAWLRRSTGQRAIARHYTPIILPTANPGQGLTCSGVSFGGNPLCLQLSRRFAMAKLCRQGPADRPVWHVELLGEFSRNPPIQTGQVCHAGRNSIATIPQ
ncbi:carboxylesterase family protein [Sphingopyxis sp.]|uniref:carboxylesterase family protein n=1 Tax=Sphingopyxis sp. TaxID=1908224 RepID=UPI0025CF49AB|nr:carboxylesterase family protein [Sphingopyxis sp.]MBK6411651.1 carboxylesterase family protein [Sphingopyxis sp.]